MGTLNPKALNSDNSIRHMRDLSESYVGATINLTS